MTTRSPLLRYLGSLRPLRSLLRVAGVLSVLLGVALALPIPANDAALPAPRVIPIPLPPPQTTPMAATLAGRHLLMIEDYHQWSLKQDRHGVIHRNLWLHGVRTQLYTAWGSPITLRAVNWYGFEYAPFVPDGLDTVPLDSLLSLVHQSGFNALRIMFANQTVEENPVVTAGLAANQHLRGMHSLDIMGHILNRAHHFGLRVILCDSRSEAGRGPELLTGLWYTAKYPWSAWQKDWITLVTRFRSQSAFVGADLRNEPHLTGQVFDTRSYYAHGPLWGAFRETYYHDRDWRYAAETMGNILLGINPHMLIVVEGVQMYLDPDTNKLTGALWGSNLEGVQYDPIVLSWPGQLVYSVHEYGPKMWLGSWFNTSTTYDSLSARWNFLWGYLLKAPKFMQAPLFVGEFGTCNDHYSCVASPRQRPESGGFWFSSFVRYLQSHPQVSWAYWAVNSTGPFFPNQRNLYSLVTPDWRHARPMVLYGLSPLLRNLTG